MPLADIQTLLLVIFTLSMTLGVAVWLASRDTRSTELRIWALAMVLHGVGYLLLMRRGVWPDWASIVFANLLLSASFVLMLHAVARFSQMHPPQWLLWGPPALALFADVLLLDDNAKRIPLLNAIYLTQQLGLLRAVMVDCGNRCIRGRLILIAGVSLGAIIFAARVLGAASGAAAIPSLTAPSLLQTLSYMCGFIALLLASLGFVFMVMAHVEQQVTEARHLLTTIFDSSDESIAMYDRTGTLLAINRTGAERFQTAPQKLVGMNLADIVPVELSNLRLQAIRRVADRGKCETLIDRRADRDYRHTYYPVEDEPRRVVAYTADITEKLAAENALKQKLEETLSLNKKLEEAHTQLLQSEKMASIGQLAAGVAHELNNPIGFVNSNLGTLKSYLTDIFMIIDAFETACRESEARGPAVDAVQALKARKDFDFLRQDVLQLLGESTDGLLRVKKIVQDLKDFSRPGETHWQWADLHQGLDSTLNIVWNEIKYKCTVNKAYGELPQVRCLPSQLNQVFMNLLVNAAHAIETQGEITITTRRLDDANVQVRISDTGSGIAPENLGRIFDPFFTTKPVGKGTGLGLAISWGIIQKHHGKIEVTSEAHQGTTFTVTLPIDQPQDEESHAVTPAQTSTS
jgi:PAS domain S-box-containing protein